jgi:hypothetical protein
MRSIKFLFVILAGVILFPKPAFSQKDYVVTAKNDTFHCKIKLDVLGHLYAYRPVKSDNYIVIDHKLIKEVYLSRDSGTYLYIELSAPRYPTWLRLMEKGAVNLYQEVLNTGSVIDRESTYWYLSKGTGPLVQIKTNAASAFNIGSEKDRIQAFVDLMNDCSYVAAEVANAGIEKNYEYDVIRNFIKMYNEQCPVK